MKNSVYILYFTFTFIDCPRINMHMIILFLKSWTDFPSPLDMCSSALGAPLVVPSCQGPRTSWLTDWWTAETGAGYLPVLLLIQWEFCSSMSQWTLKNCEHCVISPGVDNFSSGNTNISTENKRYTWDEDSSKHCNFSSTAGVAFYRETILTFSTGKKPNFFCL